jgi:hypothetical protein
MGIEAGDRMPVLEPNGAEQILAAHACGAIATSRLKRH